MLQKLNVSLNKKKKGFTLIELIIVIGILAILAVLAIPAVAGYLDNSRAQTNISNAKMIYNAASAYIASNPSAEDDDVTIDNLVSNDFLASVPKTAKNAEAGFTLTTTDGKPVITWTNEATSAAALALEDASNPYPPEEE